MPRPATEIPFISLCCVWVVLRCFLVTVNMFIFQGCTNRYLDLDIQIFTARNMEMCNSLDHTSLFEESPGLGYIWFYPSNGTPSGALVFRRCLAQIYENQYLLQYLLIIFFYHFVHTKGIIPKKNFEDQDESLAFGY